LQLAGKGNTEIYEIANPLEDSIVATETADDHVPENGT
jgi:hypothetical protein